MFYSNTQLEKFSKLSQLIFEVKLETDFSNFTVNLSEHGQRISRGFADLGFEEFVVIGNRKILSLYTGKASEVPLGHDHFFFRVFEIEDLLAIVSLFNWKIKSVKIINSNQWQIIASKIGSTELVKRKNSNFQELILDLLLE